MRGFTILFVSLGLLACRRTNDDQQGSQSAFANVSLGSGAVAPPKSTVEPVAPPLPVQTPPADAIKTASGLAFKKLVTNDAGTPIHRNDVVLFNYTGWRQATGETFFSYRDRGQPMRITLTATAPGFAEGLQLMRKGESAMLWIPAAIGYAKPPTRGVPEARVYQFDVVEVLSAPAVPDDVAAPPSTAEKLPSGMKRVMLKAGSDKTKPREYDDITFAYTVWDGTGKMLDSTTTRDRPSTAAPYKESPAMSEMLMSMTAGERARFWVDAERTKNSGKAIISAQGQVCFEVEIQQITRVQQAPPATPPDVAKPPADAKQTAKGVFYKMIKPGPGKDPMHPQKSDTVKVHYTGWTTDGRIFDSSVLRGIPSTFSLGGVIAGWTDGIPLMTTGDHMRFWIPEPLAYKGQTGKPQGMLVFDVELLEILAPTNH